MSLSVEEELNVRTFPGYQRQVAGFCCTPTDGEERLFKPENVRFGVHGFSVYCLVTCGF